MILSAFITLFSFFLLSSFELPAILYALSFYVFILFYSRFRISISRDLATVAVISSMTAFLISGLIGLARGNDITFMVRYSGGAILLPVYFFISSLSNYKLNKLVRCIFLSAFFFSAIGALYLVSTLAGLGSVSDFLCLFLGKASRSGFQDTRFYSLTLLTSSIPLSFILLFFPRGFLQFFNFSKSSVNILLIRASGVLFAVSGLFLLFSKSYVFYFVYVIILSCSLSFKPTKTISRKRVFSIVLISLAIVICSSFVISQIDASRLMGTLDFLNYDDNQQRYEQIDYYLSDGFTIIGDGLGSSFLNTPILRSWDSPYGIENSVLNLLFKFGIWSSLFIPLIYFNILCFLRINRVSRTSASDDDFTKMAIAMAPSYSFFILVSFGNPILFHVQLNFLLLISIVFSQRYISKSAKSRFPSYGTSSL